MVKLANRDDIGVRNPRPSLGFTGIPDVRDRVGPAVQRAAGAIGEAGATFGAIQQEKEAFDAETQYLKFEHWARTELENRKQNAELGAPGLTDTWRKDYNAAAQDFYRSVPASVSDKVNLRLTNLNTRMVDDAAQFEQKSRHDQAIINLGDGENTLVDRAMSDPRQYGRALQEAESLISTAPLSAVEKELRLREVRDRFARADVQRRVAGGDFEALQTDLGNIPEDRLAREQAAMQIFQGAGLSRAQAAGIVGNLVQESGLRTDVVGDDGTAFGIAQWRGERVNRLKRFAASRGADWNDFETQARFVLQEMQTHETKAWRNLQNATTAEEAAAAFIGYERPFGWTANNPTGGHGWDNRSAHARRLASGDDGQFQAANPRYDDIPWEDRQNLASGIERIQTQQYELEQRAEREVRYALTKNGYDMIRDDTLTPEWLEANRDILTVSDYKTFSNALEPDYTAKATPPGEYLRLLELADKDPESAIDEVRQAYGDGIIAKDVFTKISSRAEANMKSASGRSYASELRSYVSTSMTPPANSPESLKARKLDALFQFDDWLEANPKASREEIRKTAQELIDDYRKIQYRSGVTSLPLPRFASKTAEMLQEPDLDLALGKTLLGLKMGSLNEREAAEQAAIIRRWSDMIRYRD